MRAPRTDGLRTRPSLLARLIDWNDHASWQDFDDAYRGLIFNFAIKQGVTADEAQDVVQETMSSVAKAMRAGQYDAEKGSFRSWLLGVTYHRVSDHFRHRPRWQEARRAPSADSTRTATVERVADPRSLDPEAIWEEEWRNSVVELALKRLKARVKPKHFQIFYLREIKKQPTRTVAKALGVSSTQVYVITHRLDRKFIRATKALQRQLETCPEQIMKQ